MKDFNRHSRDGLRALQTSEFAVGNVNAHRIVRFVSFLLLRDIGSDAGDLADDFRRGALVER